MWNAIANIIAKKGVNALLTLILGPVGDSMGHKLFLSLGTLAKLRAGSNITVASVRSVEKLWQEIQTTTKPELEVATDAYCKENTDDSE